LCGYLNALYAISPSISIPEIDFSLLQAPTLAGARSLGLQLINASPELRQGIMKYAMG
jgi:hypothetical protein